MGWSNAPCNNIDGGKKCYATVVQGTGYCPKHQKPAFKNAPHRSFVRGWDKLKRDIFAKTGGVCHVCGNPGSDELDHVLAVSLGGTDDPSNLRPIHKDVAPYCHRRKTGGDAATYKKQLNTIKRRGQRKTW